MKIKNISDGRIEIKNGSIQIAANAGETIRVDEKQLTLGLRSGAFEIVQEDPATDPAGDVDGGSESPKQAVSPRSGRRN